MTVTQSLALTGGLFEFAGLLIAFISFARLWGKQWANDYSLLTGERKTAYTAEAALNGKGATSAVGGPTVAKMPLSDRVAELEADIIKLRQAITSETRKSVALAQAETDKVRFALEAEIRERDELRRTETRTALLWALAVSMVGVFLQTAAALQPSGCWPL